eukprot:COSAG01_NODE_1314_length_10760_cov_3.305131_11_plen_107_part_00
MGSDWRGTSLLLGGQAHTVVRGDGPALSQTVDIATGRAIGFAGSKYMVHPATSLHRYYRNDSHAARLSALLLAGACAGNTAAAGAAESWRRGQKDGDHFPGPRDEQ